MIKDIYEAKKAGKGMTVFLNNFPKFLNLFIYLILFNYKNPKLGANEYKDMINRSKLTNQS